MLLLQLKLIYCFAKWDMNKKLTKRVGNDSEHSFIIIIISVILCWDIIPAIVKPYFLLECISYILGLLGILVGIFLFLYTIKKA